MITHRNTLKEYFPEIDGNVKFHLAVRQLGIRLHKTKVDLKNVLVSHTPLVFDAVSVSPKLTYSLSDAKLVVCHVR